MSVVSVKLIRSRQLSVDKKGKATASRTWRVVCDDRADDADLALAAVPTIGSAWAGVPMSKKEAKEASDVPATGIVWEVSADYESPDPRDPDPDDPANAEDPRDRPLAVRLSFASQEEDIYLWEAVPTARTAADAIVDIGLSWKWGRSIVNSIGDAFPTGIKETFSDGIISVSREVDTSDFPKVWDLLKSVVNTVNVRDFNITYRGYQYKILKGEGLLGEPTSEPRTTRLASGEVVQTEAVAVSWRVRTGGWNRRVLDQGYNRAAGPDEDPNPSKKRACTDANGEPSTSPQNLNGKGVPIKTPDELPVFIVGKSKKDGSHTQLLDLLNR